MDLKENANTLKVIRMTSEEKDLLYAAEMLHDYCDKVNCEDCFFYRPTQIFTTIRECVLQYHSPCNWTLKFCTRKEGDQNDK